jgi:hypothetical protein
LLIKVVEDLFSFKRFEANLPVLLDMDQVGTPGGSWEALETKLRILHRLEN